MLWSGSIASLEKLLTVFTLKYKLAGSFKDRLQVLLLVFYANLKELINFLMISGE